MPGKHVAHVGAQRGPWEFSLFQLSRTAERNEETAVAGPVREIGATIGGTPDATTVGMNEAAERAHEGRCVLRRF